ncbi:hypothetical protein A2U01_0075393, partial [Trifolium medium]|nr:hypothetical protein [Trifolium medium]
VSWDTFTVVFVWRFKHEWRHLLPVFDEEEELDQESSPLVNLIECSPESLNDTLLAWDEFLLSTEQMEVPTMRSKYLMGKTEIPTSDFNGGIVDLP